MKSVETRVLWDVSVSWIMHLIVLISIPPPANYVCVVNLVTVVLFRYTTTTENFKLKISGFICTCRALYCLRRASLFVVMHSNMRKANYY
jgi:hypothetical protein